ncbi:carboxyl-terminal processing protease [Lewinella aquimaris]|uniref:Carboxyl-terminal processing protease n=1 Tax=Neolewinella aquimaris TaxID=1835722 RepID=A0A840E8G1_9BACT|nr:carboxy terminal-processing peptidase [Neolewinella aquimaris]MBB4079597.1 carboxyl-terminal processing protease [Neolewinella aquimaris]
MKTRGPLLFSALVLVFALFAAVNPTATPPGDAPSIILKTMLTNLQTYHYQPTDIDDAFSERVYDQYLNDLDGARLFFTQDDIDAFAPYRTLIDDESKAGEYTFYNLVQEHWTAALDKTESWYEELLAEPFDLAKSGSFKDRDENSGWAADDAELKQYWHDYMKRDLLSQIVDKREEMAKDTTGAVQPSLDSLEVEYRGKILERYHDWFKRMREMKPSVKTSQYLNSMTAVFDPHTSYFRPKDKESFDIRFSGRLEGIGATLQTDDEYTKVTSVVVGGPAWKGKELKEDDIIMGVRQKGEEMVDIKGMQLEDVVDKIRGKKGTVVSLKVKKPDGTIRDISIERDIIIIDDTYAKSLIIDDNVGGEKIGYISLPSFYADFQNDDGRFSAKDVAAELDKLKAQNVDGIILDLRNNGGGSLRDVVDMTGFFIPEGPVVQVAGRNMDKEILEDKDRRVQYDGPVVVLVNQYSASASEILAAALQDYNRAVIVGSTSTFGKGTVQRFIDMDRTISGHNDIKPLGTVKLTMQKFYRIDGGSTQLRGVVPDIILPDSRSLLETGEKEQSAPLAWSEIEPAKYSQDVYRIRNIDELKARSASRVENSPTFTRIQQNAERVKRQRDRDTYPLALTDFEELQRATRTEAEMYDDLFEDVVNPGVLNLQVDLEPILSDESKTARNDDFKKSVSKDVYIREAVSIVEDMIKLEGK